LRPSGVQGRMAARFRGRVRETAPPRHGVACGEPRGAIQLVSPESESKKDRKGVRASSSDAFQLTLDYLKQETLGPIKGLGRFLAYGIAGSIAIAVGTVLLLVSALRVLQTETGAFHGNRSWIPYLIVVALAVAIIGLSAWRIVSGPAKRRLPEREGGSDR
jgi:hypothetical protein